MSENETSKATQPQELDETTKTLATKFAKAMLSRLRSGDTWQNKRMVHFEMRLEDNFTHYLETRDPNDLIDVANFAMFLYYHSTL